MARITAPSPNLPAAEEHDGPNMVMSLFVLSLVIGVLIGLGASSLTSHHAAHTEQQRAMPVSRAAAQLGYSTEHDFKADNERAGAALLQVLQSAPGTQRLWENAESGNRGVIWGSTDVTKPDGSICRELERRTLINNAFRNANATMCHRPGQSWGDEAGWRNEGGDH